MAMLSHPDRTLLFLDGRTSGPPACENTRSLISIVWSCLGTIFLCTWVAIHPNIAVPCRRGLSSALHRVKILIVALMVPEFIIMWAMRQYSAASEITRRYEGRVCLLWLRRALNVLNWYQVAMGGPVHTVFSW
jgi:hypothetical protein